MSRIKKTTGKAQWKVSNEWESITLTKCKGGRWRVTTDPTDGWKGGTPGAPTSTAYIDDAAAAVMLIDVYDLTESDLSAVRSLSDYHAATLAD